MDEEHGHSIADVFITLITAIKEIVTACLTSPWFMIAAFVWLGYLNREQFFNLLSTIAGK